MDPTDPWQRYSSSERRAYEQVLRHVLRLPKAPAVLMLQVYPWHQGGGDEGVTAGLFYREPEGQQTVFGSYYDVPVVSLRAAAYHLMRLGVDGFKARGSRGAAANEPPGRCLLVACLPA